MYNTFNTYCKVKGEKDMLNEKKKRVRGEKIKRDRKDNGRYMEEILVTSLETKAIYTLSRCIMRIQVYQKLYENMVIFLYTVI